ncbi:MAG: ABC transporter permease [Elusimicrobia bacterium]|nr:ABC transporter permease [Elusimicrobiota bacterium]
MLAPDQEIRVITDLGSAAIEIFAFLTATFIAVRIILQEIEQKTLYLTLSRLVSRDSFLIGKYMGLLGLAAVYIILMSLALGVLLAFKGWNPTGFILALSSSVFLKLMIVSSAGVLISLVSTSSVSSFIIISFLWATGHFSSEIRHLAATLSADGLSIAGLILAGVSYIIPDLAALNCKDTFFTGGFTPNDFLKMASYALLYSSALLLFASALFRKKDL